MVPQGAERGDTSVNATYSSYTYQAACGIIGSILATFLVEWGRGGRKFAGAFFTVGAGVRFRSSLRIPSASDDSIRTGFSVWTHGSPVRRRRERLDLHGLTLRKRFVSLSLISGNCPDVPLTPIQQLRDYLLHSARDRASYEPCSSSESSPDSPKLPQFPTPHRGTGDALAGSASRLAGAFAPIIAVYSQAAKTPNGPVYASATIFIVAGLSMLALPIETRGRPSYVSCCLMYFTVVDATLTRQDLDSY